METTDFHSLPRRELQALCKKHKIPANLTNIAMADALVALFAEGAPGEDIAGGQEPKKNMKSSRTTDARQNASMSKTSRSSRRGAAKGEETKVIDGIPLIELPDTPVVPSGRKTRAREAMKTPGMSVVDAIVGAKNQEEEEATVLNSKRASAKSMRSRKTVSFALGEDGEGERGFGIEVKKTPVAPRIPAEEEIELGRRGTGRSVSARGSSQRRSGRLKAVPKMTNLSAPEERDDDKEVPISDKQEIVVAEEETSDLVIAHEADGHNEEGLQSSEWIGSEEIPEDVNPTADVVDAEAEKKSDDQLTAGDVTVGEEEAFELQHTDSEGGDLIVSSAGALASENVSDSSPEVSEAVLEDVGSFVADADEPVEGDVDESIVSGLDCTAAVVEEDVRLDVPELQEVESLADDIDHVAEMIEEDVESSDDVNCVADDDNAATANGEMAEDLDELAEDLTVSSAGALAFEIISDSSLEVSEEAVDSVVVDAVEPVEAVDEAIVRGLDGTAAVDEEDVMVDVPDVQEVESLAKDIDHVTDVIEEDVESSNDANCVAGDDNGATANDEMPEDLVELTADLTLSSAVALACANVSDSSPEIPEAVVKAVGSVVVDADEPVEGDEAIFRGLDGTAAVEEEYVMMDVPEVQEVESLAEDIGHVAEMIEEDVESSDDANCAAGDDNGATANGEMPEDLNELAEDGEAGCDNAVDTDEVIVIAEAHEDVPQDGTVATLPVVVSHPVIDAADCDEEVDELMEILEDGPKTEEYPEAACDNYGDVDEVTEDGEEQEDVCEELAAESLPEAGCYNGDELPVNGEEQHNVPEDEANDPHPEDAHPVIETTDHDEGGVGNDERMEVAEEDKPSHNSGSNEQLTEAAGEGKIPVDNTDDVVFCDVTPIAEIGSEITVTVSEEFTDENYSVTEEAASCDVDPIVEAALHDLEQIAEAIGSDGSTGNAPVEEASLAEESPENPEVSNVELEQGELLPVTEEQIIPSNTEHVEEVSEVIQELHVPVQCSDDVAEDDEPIRIPMATPTKFATVEVPCSAKRSVLRKKEAGVSDNKENAVAVLYSSNKEPVVDNGTKNKMKKNGVPTPAELEKMSLRQLRKQLEALSVHDSNHKRHEDEMVLMSGKKPERKRTALATLPDNCLKSPLPGRG